MKKQHIILWTGGKADIVKHCQPMADTLPDFPAPLPLYRMALIEYHWGATKFEIVASACSLRISDWGEQKMDWLHCKAMQTSAIQADQSFGLINVLIPAPYITKIQPGPTYRINHHGHSDDLGVFAPIYPAPASALPLETIASAVAELSALGRN